MSNVIPFNPLDKKALGASVAEALFAKPVHPLGTIEKFAGAGIYAIYYTGPFPAYTELSGRNANGRFDAPIYVGKAVPAGSRKGTNQESSDLEASDSVATYTGNALFSRIREHANSIRAATNLDIDDFHVRFLVVDDIWIPLGESLIIARFVPLWNSLVDGFGNHAPGGGRLKGLRPRWDVLHPGRAWAPRHPDRPETAEDIAREAEEYLRNSPKAPLDHFVEPPGA